MRLNPESNKHKNSAVPIKTRKLNGNYWNSLKMLLVNIEAASYSRPVCELV